MDQCSVNGAPAPTTKPSLPLTAKGGGKGKLRTPDEDLLSLLSVVSRTAEIRMLDALLRVCRDRLLASSSRLSLAAARASFWVRWHDGGLFNTGLQSWHRRTLRGTTVEDDRRHLVLSRAAYRSEVDRLGRVQGLLLGRPRWGEKGADDAAAEEAATAGDGGEENGGGAANEHVVGAEGAKRVLLADAGGEQAGGWEEASAVDRSLSDWADGALSDNEATWLAILTHIKSLAKSRCAGA